MIKYLKYFVKEEKFFNYSAVKDLNCKNRMREYRIYKFFKYFIPDLRELWIRFGIEDQPYGGGYRMDIHITPAIIWTPLQKSILASSQELGIIARSGSFGVEWWIWKATIRYGISQNINKNK